MFFLILVFYISFSIIFGILEGLFQVFWYSTTPPPLLADPVSLTKRRSILFSGTYLSGRKTPTGPVAGHYKNPILPFGLDLKAVCFFSDNVFWNSCIFTKLTNIREISGSEFRLYESQAMFTWKHSTKVTWKCEDPEKLVHTICTRKTTAQVYVIVLRSFGFLITCNKYKESGKTRLCELWILASYLNNYSSTSSGLSVRHFVCFGRWRLFTN